MIRGSAWLELIMSYYQDSELKIRRIKKQEKNI